MRLLEGLKSALLVVLVAASVFLSSQIWFSPVFSKPPRLIQAPYVPSGSHEVTDWRSLVMPRRIYLHVGGGRTTRAEPVVGSSMWQLIARLGSLVPEGEMVPADPAEVDSLRSGGGGALGVEVVMASAAPFHFWQHAWQAWSHRADPPLRRSTEASPAAETASVPSAPGSGRPGEPPVPPGAPGTGESGTGGGTEEEGIFDEGAPPVLPGQDQSPVDRVYLFRQRSRLIFLLEQGHRFFKWEGGAADPDHPLHAEVNQAARALDTLFHSADRWLDEGREVRRHQGSYGSLHMAPGIYTPVRPGSFAIMQTVPQPINVESLIRSMFVDLTFLKTVDDDDFTIYSDGRGVVTWRAPVAEYNFPAALGGPLEDDALTVLRKVIEFTNERGGWPEGAYLRRIEPMRERGGLQLGGPSEPIGYHLEFGIVLDGVPVDVEPLVSVEYGRGGVSSFRRRFELYEPMANLRTLEPGSVYEALERVNRLGRDILPDIYRIVEDVELAYLPVGSGQPWVFLTWRFDFPPGPRVWADSWAVEPRVWVEQPGGILELWLGGPPGGE